MFGKCRDVWKMWRCLEDVDMFREDVDTFRQDVDMFREDEEMFK